MSAALEFAVQALKVKHIVVLGHAQCGGIRAFAEQAAPLSPGDFIGHWMALIAPAAEALGPRGDAPLADYLTRLEQASVVTDARQSDDLPLREILAERGRLVLHGAYFGVATGELSVLDRASGVFMPVAADAARQGFRRAALLGTAAHAHRSFKFAVAITGA